MIKDKILILNGGISEIPLIQEARRLGFYVVTSGNDPKLIGHSFADEYIAEDYSDGEAILKLVQDNDISGIVSCANDFGAITASYVSEKMGWKGHDSYENALLLHQKDCFKKFFQENDIPSPRFSSFDNKEEALLFVKESEYPIIIKAVDLTGGKGINKAENYEAAVKAIEVAFSRSRKKHIVIESYIEGHQESIVTFVVDKQVVASVACNSYSPINPYLIQTEIIPSDYSEKLKEELYGIVNSICDKLNLADGVLTLQYKVKNGKPYIIELMRRCLGNQFLTIATKATGFPWHEALIRAELGMDCSTLEAGVPDAKYVGFHGIMGRHNGKIKKVTIAPEIEKHIYKRVDILQMGDMLSDYMNERIAYIYYTYDNRDEMLEAAKHFNDQINLEFEND